jgi:hypothetical protein
MIEIHRRKNEHRWVPIKLYITRSLSLFLFLFETSEFTRPTTNGVFMAIGLLGHFRNTSICIVAKKGGWYGVINSGEGSAFDIDWVLRF